MQLIKTVHANVDLLQGYSKANVKQCTLGALVENQKQSVILDASDDCMHSHKKLRGPLNPHTTRGLRKNYCPVAASVLSLEGFGITTSVRYASSGGYWDPTEPCACVPMTAGPPLCTRASMRS